MADIAQDLFEDDIKSAEYQGVIEDIDDPNFSGRCKIRVFGKFGHADDSENQIPTDDLPWASPAGFSKFGSETGAGNFSTPKVGAMVKVYFENGDIYSPRYYALEEISEDLIADIEGSYENAHVLVHDSDEDLKIYYTKEKGILIYNKGSIIRILNDNSILIDHKDSSATIELNGNDIDIVTNGTINQSAPNSINMNSNEVHANGVRTRVGANDIYSAVNGEVLMQLLKIIAAGVDAKFPTTPGQFAQIVQSMEQLILSQTVSTSP